MKAELSFGRFTFSDSQNDVEIEAAGDASYGETDRYAYLNRDEQRELRDWLNERLEDA